MFELKKFYQPGFNLQEHWDEKYARMFVAGKSSDEFRRQGFWPVLSRYLEPGKSYLDAGCGVGGWALFLHDEGYDVTGIDTARRTIQAMTEYNPDLKLKVASMAAIPAADHSFDGLIAIGTLEYLANQVPGALREANRVLKTDGFIFLEVAYANILRRVWYIPLKRLQYAFKAGRNQQPTFSHYLFSRSDLRQLLPEAGFEIVEVHPHDLPEADSHYGLYADYPWLRGSRPYQLNIAGRIKKIFLNALSPWIVAAGIVVVAKKKSQS